MKIIIKLILPLLLVSCSSLQNKDVSGEYIDLVRQAYANKSSIDFTRLRMAYADSAGYRPYTKEASEKIEAIYSLMKRNDIDQCAEQVEKLLKDNFASLAGHFIAYQCRRLMGDSEKSAFHRYVLSGLMDSISSSGDGLSFQSAYIAISTDESKWYVRLLNMKLESQELIQHEGHSYHRVTILDPIEKDQFDFYFDISTQITKGYQDF